MQLAELLNNIKALEVAGSEQIEIKGITHNSKTVKPGYLFVAIKGFQTDGHKYIKDALEAGASVIVAQDKIAVPAGTSRILVEDTREALGLLASAFYNYPSKKMRLVGVTGTNGKTTTSYLINSMFRWEGYKVGLVGTIANYIGDKKLDVQHTTPEAHQLQELFQEMVNEGVQAAVMEVSSHALSLNRVTGTEFDVGVFTNLTQDHLDFHNNMEEYFQAKLSLFKSIGQGSKKFPKFAVINKDDPYSERIIPECKVPVITYGLSEDADVRAVEVDAREHGSTFKLISKYGSVILNLKLGGLFNVYNALAAYAVGLGSGISQETLVSSLENLEGVPGRFEMIECGQDFTVVVDYAHTPDGLENILKAARAISPGRLITVFGCGGDRDRAKRPLMGKIAGQYSDLAIITSDNPRTEDPANIINDIEAGLKSSVNLPRYRVIPDRHKAIEAAIAEARAGDFVIIAGKGHEDYQILGNKKVHFDDREEARKIIRAKLTGAKI